MRRRQAARGGARRRFRGRLPFAPADALTSGDAELPGPDDLRPNVNDQRRRPDRIGQDAGPFDALRREGHEEKTNGLCLSGVDILPGIPSDCKLRQYFSYKSICFFKVFLGFPCSKNYPL